MWDESFDKDEKETLDTLSGSVTVEQPQPFIAPKKPKVAKKEKPEKLPVALKTCRIRLEDGEVMLTKGAKVNGLNSKELAALKKAKFVE